MELKFKTRWDYSGWKQRSFFPSCSTLAELVDAVDSL